VRGELPLSGHPRDGLRAGAGLDPVQGHLREHPVRRGKALLAPDPELLPGGVDGCGVGRWVAGAHDDLLGVFSPALAGPSSCPVPSQVFPRCPSRVESAGAWRDPRSSPRCRCPRIPLPVAAGARIVFLVGINAIFIRDPPPLTARIRLTTLWTISRRSRPLPGGPSCCPAPHHPRSPRASSPSRSP